jgi:hypothetical protein
MKSSSESYGVDDTGRGSTVDAYISSVTLLSHYPFTFLAHNVGRMTFYSTLVKNETHAKDAVHNGKQCVYSTIFSSHCTFTLLTTIHPDLHKPILKRTNSYTRLEVFYSKRTRVACHRPSPKSTTTILHTDHTIRHNLDMDMHSPLHQRLTDRLYAQLTRPISTRTRSRTQRFSETPPSLLSPESGTFTPKRSTPRTLNIAARKLKRTRLKLKRELEANDEFRYEDGYLKSLVRSRIHQLSRLAPTGALGFLPSPRPARWDSDAKMQRRRRVYLSLLCEVERNWSVQELEEEFGILPGEGRDEVEDLGVEMDVEEGLKGEGRVMEDMLDGYCVGGVWRELSRMEEGVRREMVRMVGFGEVMNWRCVSVVREVWRSVGGYNRRQ